MTLDAMQELLYRWVGSFMLVLSRVLGFIATGPVVSETNLPNLVKLGLAVALSVILSANIPSAVNVEANASYILNLLSNLVVGLAIGFLSKLIVDTVQTAGEMIDLFLGISFATVVNPSLGTTTLISNLFMRFGTALFMNIGGFELTLMSLGESFRRFALIGGEFTALQLDYDVLIDSCKDILELAIVISSPVLVVILFMDISLGIMSRAAQQINPFQLSFTLKPLVGLIVLLFTVPYMYERICKMFMKGLKIFPP